jgi:hypothetical protein
MPGQSCSVKGLRGGRGGSWNILSGGDGLSL